MKSSLPQRGRGTTEWGMRRTARSSLRITRKATPLKQKATKRLPCDPPQKPHGFRGPRVILSGAKRNRTFSSEIPDAATLRRILAVLGFRQAQDDTDEKAPKAGSTGPFLPHARRSRCFASPYGGFTPKALRLPGKPSGSTTGITALRSG